MKKIILILLLTFVCSMFSFASSEYIVHQLKNGVTLDIVGSSTGKLWFTKSGEKTETKTLDLHPVDETDNKNVRAEGVYDLHWKILNPQENIITISLEGPLTSIEYPGKDLDWGVSWTVGETLHKVGFENKSAKYNTRVVLNKFNDKGEILKLVEGQVTLNIKTDNLLRTSPGYYVGIITIELRDML